MQFFDRPRSLSELAEDAVWRRYQRGEHDPRVPAPVVVASEPSAPRRPDHATRARFDGGCGCFLCAEYAERHGLIAGDS
ncbi:hypothetical protein [Streptodolium elevatio]|uniref:Uncharacterized protein n=1 Tax=Streptodolium elevatio TaxID=3157996 RepID=A0ABV3DLJ2_9ACTN